MADVSFAAQAKSDQLNAVDIMGVEPIITVRQVVVNQSDQPVSIYYNGDNNRPWKVSKGMIRILIAGWGKDSDAWVGKSVKIYCDPKVKYAGQEVGGVRIRAMSDINTNGLLCTIALNRKQREPYPVQYLSMERPEYPQAKFEKGLPTMIKWMKEDCKSIEQIVAQCQQTGDLTESQLKTLQEHAPLHVEDGE